MEDWKEVRLYEVCDFNKNSTNIIDDITYYLYSLPAFDNNKTPEISLGKNIKSNKYIVEKNSILFNKLNVRFKRVWNINKIEKNSICSTEFIPIKCNNNLIYKNFLYYFLITDKITKFMEANKNGTSSSHQRIKPEILYNFEINLPPLEEQKVIAKTLSCLDDKIELNNKINKNLEEMAQVIFKKWFIDFDYPLTEEEKAQGGRQFVDSELGKIPKGWKVVDLGKVTKQIKDKVGEKKDYKVLSAVSTGNLMLSEEYFSKQVFSKDISKYIDLKLYDFAYNPSRINIGSIGINTYNFNCCVSPIYVVFRVQEPYHNFFNMLLKTNRIKEEINVRCNGSVRQALNYKDFALIKIVYPNIDIICKFNNIYNIILEKSKFNNKQNEKLIQIRDTLLSKLINGDVRVPF